MNDGFVQIKDLLPKAVSKYGVQREVRGALVRDRARQAVKDVWGSEVTEVRPLFFKEGVLVVEVENSAWGQEVFMKEEELIELIGKELGVKEVRTRVRG